MKALFNTIHYFLIAGIIAIGLLLLGTLAPIPGNFKVKIVKSGSMEPTIRTGGIVVIRPEASYKVGDIVTFGADTKTQIPTTHRIVDSKGEGASQVFSTKGDANDSPDPTQTRPADIRGKVLFTIPYVGFILDFARKPIGFGLLVGIPAFAIILEEIGKIIREVKRIRRRKNRNNNDDERNQSSGGERVSVMRREEAPRNFTQRRMLVDGIVPRQALAGNTPQRKVNSKKMFVAVLLVLGTFTGLSSVGSTSSYFADVEFAGDNLLKAGAVFLTLSALHDTEARVSSFSALRALDAPSEEENEYGPIGTETFKLSVGAGEGSLPLYYSAWGEFTKGSPEECGILQLAVKTEFYSWEGQFKDFVLPATTTADTFEFTLTLPESNILAPGAVCAGDLVFRAHPVGISNLISNIFTDEKRYSFTIRNYGEPIGIPEVLGEASTTEEAIFPPEATSTESIATTTPEIQSGGGGGSVEVIPPSEPPVVESAPVATSTDPVASTTPADPGAGNPPAPDPVVSDPPAESPVENPAPPVENPPAPDPGETTTP